MLDLDDGRFALFAASDRHEREHIEMNVSAKVRILVTALSTFWVCWIGWGPAFTDGMDNASRAIHDISGAPVMLALSAAVGVFSLAALFVSWSPRGLRAVLAVSLAWWVFISVLLVIVDAPIAAGFAAIGTIGGFVAWWNAAR